jgi:hypothetical protein
VEAASRGARPRRPRVVNGGGSTIGLGGIGGGREG